MSLLTFICALAVVAPATAQVARRQLAASTVTVTPTISVAAPVTVTASAVTVTVMTSTNSSTAPATSAIVNTTSFDQVLYTALGSSLFALAVTNPSSASAVIASQIAANGTPSWYSALPSDIKTALLVIATVTSTNASTTAVSNATAINLAPLAQVTTASNGTVYLNGTAIGVNGTGIYPNGTAITPARNGTAAGNSTTAGNSTAVANSTSMSTSMSMTSSSTGGVGGLVSTASSVVSTAAPATSSSTGGAAMATAGAAVFGIGAAGAMGLLGLFAL